MLIPMSIIMNKLKDVNQKVYSGTIPQDTTFPFIVTEVSQDKENINLVVSIWDHEPNSDGEDQVHQVLEKLKNLIYTCRDSYLRLQLQHKADVPSDNNPMVRVKKLVFRETAYLL